MFAAGDRWNEPRTIWIEGGSGRAGIADAAERACDIIPADESARASADRMGVGEGECHADGCAVGAGDCGGRRVLSP